MLMNTDYGLVMIRPAAFQFNIETAPNNFFQKNIASEGIQQKVLREFDVFIETLRKYHIRVDVIEDTPTPVKPDAIFPNNWLGMLPHHTIVVFPMFAENRRLEKRQDIIHWLKQEYLVENEIDLSENEKVGEFLEGTGSIIFDHENKCMFAAVSPRTRPEIVGKFASNLGYELLLFHAKDASGNEIYHTNVIMTMGNNYCVICLDAIEDDKDRELILNWLVKNNKELVDISFKQMENFCGNALQVRNKEGKDFLVCSISALSNFTPSQITILEKYNPIITVDIQTIETIGGGSARCMMAENYLEPRQKVF